MTFERPADQDQALIAAHQAAVDHRDGKHDEHFEETCAACVAARAAEPEES